MKLVVRKNQSTLIDSEKKHFVDAVLALKKNGTYDRYVRAHLDNVSYGHRGPGFLPWHRQFLRSFEQDLQNVMQDPLLSLPYWDWSVDNSKTSSIWGSGFMGGDGTTPDGQVTDGPFAFNTSQWTLNVRVDPNYPNYLQRRFGKGAGSLPAPSSVTITLNETPYDVAPWDIRSSSGFRNRLEGWIGDGMHNRVHLWVGGSMLPMTSPNDPVFWLHHCFIDKLWADWELRHPDQQPYLPTEGAAPGHNLNDPMPPWNQTNNTVRPADVLDHRSLGYRYDTEDYLWKDEELAPYPTQWLNSANGKYYLGFDATNGQLFAQSREFDKPYWVSGKRGTAGKCIMQQDGNLVIYDPAGKPIWASGTDGNLNSYLMVRDDGVVAIYHPDGSGPIWTSAKG